MGRCVGRHEGQRTPVESKRGGLLREDCQLSDGGICQASDCESPSLFGAGGPEPFILFLARADFCFRVLHTYRLFGRKELAQILRLIAITPRLKDAWEGEETAFSEVC